MAHSGDEEGLPNTFFPHLYTHTYTFLACSSVWSSRYFLGRPFTPLSPFPFILLTRKTTPFSLSLSPLSLSLSLLSPLSSSLSLSLSSLSLSLSSLSLSSLSLSPLSLSLSLFFLKPSTVRQPQWKHYPCVLIHSHRAAFVHLSC